MEKSNEDELRRQKEISMFAAFALGGEKPIEGFDHGLETADAIQPFRDEQVRVGHGIDIFKEIDDRRRSSKLPVSPLSSDESNPSFKDDVKPISISYSNISNKNDAAERLRERSVKPWSNAFLNQSVTNDDDDGLILSTNDTKYGAGTTRTSRVSGSMDSSFSKEMNEDSVIAHKTQKAIKPTDAVVSQSNMYENRDVFLKTATTAYQENDSGTFSTYSEVAVNKEKPNLTEHSDLDAAVASLSKPDPNNKNAPLKRSSRIVLPIPLLQQEQHRLYPRSKAEEIGMFTEKVIMPRPLFFGPILPPRILSEARQMIRKAVTRYEEDQQLLATQSCPLSPSKSTKNGTAPPRLYELPASVRNVVGALREYGYGQFVDVIQDLAEDSPREADVTATESKHDLIFRGSPYVSTYQPVWGNDVRLERVKFYRKQQKKLMGVMRPKVLTNSDRSLTAPARIPFSMTSDEEDEESDCYDDNDNNVSLLEFFPDNDQDFSPLKQASNADTIAACDKPLMGHARENHRTKPTGSQQSSQKRHISDLSPNELFTMWLRNDDDSFAGTTSVESMSSHRSKESLVASTSPPTSGRKTFASNQTIGDSVGPIKSKSNQSDIPAKMQNVDSDTTVNKAPLSEQELFSQWAQGNVAVSTLATNGRQIGSISFSNKDKANFTVESSLDSFNTMSNTSSFNPANTFQRLPQISRSDRESDDGSVIDDEQKKQVGINDHLSKAIALLSEEGQASTNDGTTLEQSWALLSQGTSDGSRKRPLTNYELSSGCIPIFGVDDAALPQEADLGIHQTKEEQQRAQEQKRSQEIIEKFVAPNVFGPIACPNPATSPDDFHGWTSRAISSVNAIGERNPITTLDSNSSPVNFPESTSSRQFNSVGIPQVPETRETSRSRSEGYNTDVGLNSPSQQQRKLQQQQAYRHAGRPPKPRKEKSSNARYTSQSASGKGRNRGHDRSRIRFGWWSVSDDNIADDDDAVNDDDEGTDDNLLQLPPIHHSSMGVHVVTSLDPKPEDLRAENLPLSRMHSAISFEQSLPYLSDRPPSYRHLQIDTQTIAFPPIKGEIEPFFCSLAIYNVETMSIVGSSPATVGSAGSNGSAKTKAAPIPNLKRCGRVTETLSFDYVTDEDVIRRCSGSLYPYEKMHFNVEGRSPDSLDQTANQSLEEEENRKLQSTRCGVFPIPSNLSIANLYAVLIVRKVLSDEADLESYVKIAGTAGSNPVDVEKHRARAEKNCNQHGAFLMPFAFGIAPLLQVFGIENPLIPSSRAVQIPLFRFTDKESQIIDHIMVMLFPKANHKANGIAGPAPTTNGGTAMLVMRNFGYLGLHSVVDSKSSLARDRLVAFTGELQVRRRDETEEIGLSSRTDVEQVDGYQIILPDWHPQYIAEPTVHGGRFRDDAVVGSSGQTSKSYAQELLPLPLQASSRLATGMANIRGHSAQEDIEPFYYTSFCNELLCQPRILHGLQKGNVVVKVELRDVEWSEKDATYLAHLPSCGPSLHNTRRGPFLVQSSFSSCTSRRSHQFIDEFKIKLPLDLNHKNDDEANRNLSILFTLFKIKVGNKGRWKRGTMLLFGSNTSVEAGLHGVSGSTHLEQIACGFLPISERSCLLENGLHDVRIVYKSSPASDNSGRGSSSTLILRELFDDSRVTNSHGKEDSCAEETTLSENSFQSDKLTNYEAVESNEESRDLAAWNDESPGKPRGFKVTNEPMTLSVRVAAYSSLHSQNGTVSDFLNQETDIPLLSQLPNKTFLSTLRMGRDYLSKNTGLDSSHNKIHSLDEILMESTIAIADHDLCSVTSSAGHILRIMSRLWRSLICGNGEPNLAWSNPGTPVPLRAHSFATIVHLVGATSLYLAKNGVSELDGNRKFSVVTFGRVVALLFDEGKLFGDQSVEKFDGDYWASREALHLGPAKSKSPLKKSLPKRRMHFRNNYDLFNDMPPREAQKPQASEILSSTAGDLASPPQKRFAPVVPWSSDTSELSETQCDLPSPKLERKVDSKMDFQQAFRAANSETEADSDVHAFEISFGRLDNSLPGSSNGGSADMSGKLLSQAQRSGVSVGKAFVQAFGDSSGNRRWMTAPTNMLLTIPESDIGDDSDNELNTNEYDSMSTSTTDFGSIPSTKPSDVDGFGDVIGSASKRTKQMRRPRRPPQGAESAKGDTTTQGSLLPEAPLLLTSDDDIETKGTAFLDTIGASIGVSFSISNKNGEEQRVGSSHHRNKKNPNRSSIDWSLMSENLTILAQPQTKDTINAAEEMEEEEQDDETMNTLKVENYSVIQLPNFLDRLIVIGQSSADGSRWFPYAYEVIIMQWAAILSEQRSCVDKITVEHHSASSPANPEGISGNRDFRKASHRSVGGAIASAPLLFELIKQSLGFRIHSLFTQILSKNGSCLTPPVATLDDTLMSHLEQVITMVTDSCIDSRNFDSWELRQMSIDVNDAIVRFLRDLYSFLAPSAVHRLILAYLARFVTNEGKLISERDSMIGLRCSWEITKLRLNAITAFVRFQEFIKVNSPQMLNWTNWWMNSPSRMTHKFYDDVLDRYKSFRLSAFVVNEDGKSKSIDIPKMRPHWLAEVVVDICLLGTEHAEQYIQHRSASLLHELFWSCSQESILAGTSSPVSSMYITFLEKVVSNVSYLANFSSKSQLRKDILLCAIFVMQSAHVNLLRALWRNLIIAMSKKDLERVYFGEVPTDAVTDSLEGQNKLPANESKEEPNILGMFSLLNLALRTVEYEGCDDHIESDNSGDHRDILDAWHREFLLCRKRSRGKETTEFRKAEDDLTEVNDYTSSTSRKWQAHDGSLVIVNTGNYIVRELYSMLRNSPHGKDLLNPAVQHGQPTCESKRESSGKAKAIVLSKGETILFVRAATSLYLHALALRESDVVLVRTFRFSAEVIKMFGISVFLEAVGETLQHWMRVISFNCGARRAPVRIEATDLLELILRSSWECFGSFFRIRVPLLAVQTEVLERIVAIAASRYYREQRKTTTSFEPFSNLQAESSLVPLWRTLDRIQKLPASQNIAFRGALIRIAGKLKKLYRAYVAARVLSFIKGGRDLLADKEEKADLETDAQVRAMRINLLRVVNASAGHSKQFLGFQGTAQMPSSVAHFEAVEDALIDAADVFSPTELPEHRVAWLRMLAEFHSGRRKHAEEATCHHEIHVTLKLAARLHGSLWSNTPFLPWTDNIPDPVVYIDGDAIQAEPDAQSELFYEGNDWEYGKRMESANSFRRIFYRVANSIAVGNSEWDAGVNKSLFYGITFSEEYSIVSPWITLREMEENMAEEVEAAGHLFLKAGIIESSRFAWNLATLLYAEKFSYAKLSMAYSNLAKAVVSQVPLIDTCLPQEVLTSLGRFYRVWFHGGAPDDLIGVEFVYRTQSDIPLKRFGEELREVIKSIIPDKTPIHLVLDGVSEERQDESSIGFTGFSRIGPAPLEPVRIKVTPLCPLFETKMRGLPDWFLDYVDESFGDPRHISKNDDDQRGFRRRKEPTQRNGNDPHHDHFRSFSATIFSSTGSATATLTNRRGPLSTVGNADRILKFGGVHDSSLRGVDKFSFVQSRDRSKGSKEWWKTSTGDYAEKSLKVTQLQVAQAFPACVARQVVAHRLVYTQSPLEVGIDALCQWCAILFRTAVATAGMAVLKKDIEPGIGTDAAKVVADCIHGSRVKDFGMVLLKKESDLLEGENSSDFIVEYGRLSEDEVVKLQRKLGRLLITFIELLHLLIVRNRSLLLNTIKERKKHNDIGGTIAAGVTNAAARLYSRATSAGSRFEFTTNIRRNISAHKNLNTDGYQSDSGVISDMRSNHNNGPNDDQQSCQSVGTTTGARTDSAIAVQSELQRSLIKLAKDLYPRIQGILQSETPRWLKNCTQDTYFSSGSYQQTKLMISEELSFVSIMEGGRSDSNYSRQRSDSHLSHSDNGDYSPRGSIAGESHESVISRGSENFV